MNMFLKDEKLQIYIIRGKNMSKSSKNQIDKDEKKVILELQKNAKESIDKIAKKCMVDEREKQKESFIIQNTGYVPSFVIIRRIRSLNLDQLLLR